MAISLLFGPIVATTLTLAVVPLDCISANGAFRQKPSAETPGTEAAVCPLPLEERAVPLEGQIYATFG